MTTYPDDPSKDDPSKDTAPSTVCVHTEAIVSAHVRVTYAQCIYLASKKDNAKDR